MSERERLQRIAPWYGEKQLTLDRRLAAYRYQSIRPFLRPTRGLELGTGDGLMTENLCEDFSTLVAVDGSRELLNGISVAPGLIKVCSLFEEFRPSVSFDTIVMDHVLEHVERPIDLLKDAAGWLADGGRIILGVPNGLSFHRLVAVKMGLLRSPTELNDRDVELGHRRVYTPGSLFQDIERSGLMVSTWGGVFFKPLSNRQIELQWSEEMIEGCFLLGRDFPANAAELYAVCERPR